MAKILLFLEKEPCTYGQISTTFASKTFIMISRCSQILIKMNNAYSTIPLSKRIITNEKDSLKIEFLKSMHSESGLITILCFEKMARSECMYFK